MLYVLKIARPWDTDKSTWNLLKRFSEKRVVCQKVNKTLIKYQACLPSKDKLVFCDELSLELVLLDGQSVLQVIDAATHFSAVTVLDTRD